MPVAYKIIKGKNMFAFYKVICELYSFTQDIGQSIDIDRHGYLSVTIIF